ncbi:MAG: glutamate racemase [Chitinophagales bacterium]
MLKNNFPLGIFDSGIGGLTIADAIIKCLPHEDILYFGDTAHLPYGDKSPELVRKYAAQITEFLLEHNCKMLVIACNTASAFAYDFLQENYGQRIKIINVVEPLVENLEADRSLSKIAIIGTRGTIASGVYPKKIKAVIPNVEVVCKETPLLAPMIEAGFFHDKISQEIIEAYLSDQQFKNIDAIVLACTHYPLIKKEIQVFFGEKVKVFDSTDFTQKAVKNVLEKEQLLNNQKKKGQHRFFLSDNTASFRATAKILFGSEIESEFYALSK